MTTSAGAKRGAWIAVLGALAPLLAAQERRSAPHPPASSIASLQHDPALRVELVAAEPLVIDPVAFAFDEHERLYVVEARGYPDLPGQPTREGRVALLEDVDRDGRYDRRTEFAGGFTHPSGIAVWRGGVLLTCAPDVHYLKDTDGDGVADQRTLVLTGFQTGASAQNYASHPTLGLDGWIYLTCGLRSGGAVTSPLHPGRPGVEFPPMDGRFHPDDFRFETTGGRSQFGLAFDAFGRRFVCDNRNPVLQVMLEPAHLRRNPHLQFAETMQAVSRVQGEAEVRRISRAAVTADFIPTLLSAPHAGTFTSACGLVVFQGSGLPAGYDGSILVCEPAQNLIQRQVIRPHGASFRSEPVFDRGREFLASPDVWFRPVFLANGPGGALYVADMHRAEIDHPTFIPEEARQRLDFSAGRGTGRIYRVVDARSPAAEARTRPDVRADLPGALESPEAWTRETARRLLLERADPATLPRLRSMATGSGRAEARSSALWLLHGLGGLSPDLIIAALRDPDARVREQGVILAAGLSAGAPTLADRLAGMANDPEARVRFLVALNLGDWDRPESIRALATIARRDAEDRWTRAAVLSGIGARPMEFTEALLTGTAPAGASFGLIVREASRIVGAGATPADAQRLLGLARTAGRESRWLVPVTLGLLEGSAARGGPGSAGGGPLARLLAGENGSGHDAPALLQHAGRLALDAAVALDERLQAVTLLGYGGFESTREVLGELLDPRHPAELRREAVRAFERIGDVRGAKLLVRPSHWPAYDHALRSTVVSALSARPGWPEVLFAAIERGTVRPAEIPLLQRNHLLRRSPPAVRQKAAALFEAKMHDRMQVYRSYLDVLKLDAEAKRGEDVFARVCATCHTYDRKGGHLGPDLTGIRHQPSEAILLHTLVPNSEIAPTYESVLVTTKRGETLAGRIVAETEGSLTLRTTLGTDETLLRHTIASYHRSGVSLMPDGLEDALTRQELADLIAYLRSGGDGR